MTFTGCPKTCKHEPKPEYSTLWLSNPFTNFLGGCFGRFGFETSTGRFGDEASLLGEASLRGEFGPTIGWPNSSKGKSWYLRSILRSSSKWTKWTCSACSACSLLVPSSKSFKRSRPSTRVWDRMDVALLGVSGLEETESCKLRRLGYLALEFSAKDPDGDGPRGEFTVRTGVVVRDAHGVDCSGLKRTPPVPLKLPWLDLSDSQLMAHHLEPPSPLQWPGVVQWLGSLVTWKSVATLFWAPYHNWARPPTLGNWLELWCYILLSSALPHHLVTCATVLGAIGLTTLLRTRLPSRRRRLRSATTQSLAFWSKSTWLHCSQHEKLSEIGTARYCHGFVTSLAELHDCCIVTICQPGSIQMESTFSKSWY